MSNTEYNGAQAIVTLDGYDDVRFIVEPDNDVWDPVEDSGAPVEVYAFRGGYSSVWDSGDGDWSRLFREFWDSHGTPYKALEMVRRYAVIWHGWEPERAEDAFTIYAHRGHSQSEWLDLFVAVTEEDYGNAVGWAEEWSQWARGDVFMVTAERYDACGLDECHAPDELHWEEIEAGWLSGIYADDAEGAAKYYAVEYLEEVSQHG